MNCTKNNKCGNCSKCSRVPCSEAEIYEIAKNLNVWIDDVKRINQDILYLLEAGEFKRKYKTVYYTLHNWVRRALSMGRITEMNEYQKSAFKFEDPEHKKKVKEVLASHPDFK